jgi:hypothetical protein
LRRRTQLQATTRVDQQLGQEASRVDPQSSRQELALRVRY